MTSIWHVRATMLCTALVAVVLHRVAPALFPADALALLSALGITVSTQSAEGLLKTVYTPALMEDIVTHSDIVDWFRTDANIKTAEGGGKYVESSYYTRLAGIAQSRAENDYLPEPVGPETAVTRVPLTKMVGTIELTGDAKRKIDGDVGAFIDLAPRLLKDTEERVRLQYNRQYLGTGIGIMARVASKGATNTITLQDAYGVAGYDDAFMQFNEGDSIVFSASPVGAALRNPGAGQSAVVTNVAGSMATGGGTITLALDAALFTAIAVGDYIFAGTQSGTAAPNGGVNREMSGLLAGVDDGGIVPTYFNVNRLTGNDLFKAPVYNVSGAPYNGTITPDLLVELDIIHTTKSGGAQVDALVLSTSAALHYNAALQSKVVINDPRGQLVGGTDVRNGLSVILADRTIKFKVPPSLPSDLSFGLTLGTWTRFTDGQWDWDESTGALFKQVVDGVGRKDAFWGYGHTYENLACTKPRRNFRIEGIARRISFAGA